MSTLTEKLRERSAKLPKNQKPVEETPEEKLAREQMEAEEAAKKAAEDAADAEFNSLIEELKPKEAGFDERLSEKMRNEPEFAEKFREKIKREFKKSKVRQRIPGVDYEKKVNMWEVQEKLSNAIGALINSEPFYGLFIMKFNRIFDNGVGTAGVTIIKNRLYLVVSPNFWDSLTLEEGAAIIKHEVLHILMQHVVRSGNRHHQLSNIAMDLAINQFIQHLPKWTLNLKSYEHLGLHLPEDQPWEIYYELLRKKAKELHEKNKCDDENGGMGFGMGNIFGDSLDDHDGWADADENGDAVDENGNPIPSARDFIAEQIRKAANEAADQSKSQGHLPGLVERILEQLNKKSKINWKKQLRQWFANNINSDKRFTFTRESRKIDSVFPGKRRYPIPEFHLYVDTSGSVSDEEFHMLMNEVDAICKAFKVTVTLSFFDTRVSSTWEYKPGMKLRRTDGGTDFQCCLDDAKEKKLRQIIILTDTHAGVRDYYKVKVLWVCTPGQNGEHLVGKKIVLDKDV